MRRVHLIPEWRKAWRFHTVQAATLLTLVSMAQADLLPYIKPLLSSEVWPKVTAVVAGVIVVLRFLAQDTVHDKKDGQP